MGAREDTAECHCNVAGRHFKRLSSTALLPPLTEHSHFSAPFRHHSSSLGPLGWLESIVKPLPITKPRTLLFIERISRHLPVATTAAAKELRRLLRQLTGAHRLMGALLPIRRAARLTILPIPMGLCLQMGIITDHHLLGLMEGLHRAVTRRMPILRLLRRPLPLRPHQPCRTRRPSLPSVVVAVMPDARMSGCLRVVGQSRIFAFACAACEFPRNSFRLYL